MNPETSFASKGAKFYLFVIGALTAVAFAWMIMNLIDLQSVEKGIASDKDRLKKIRLIGPELSVLVEEGITAEQREKEQSKSNWLTFFDNIAVVAGFTSDRYILPSEREVRGRNYIEHRFDIKLKGVGRRSTAHFLWEVEKRRSYLKASEVKLQRPRKAGESEDIWDGKVVVAYREKPKARK